MTKASRLSRRVRARLGAASVVLAALLIGSCNDGVKQSPRTSASARGQGGDELSLMDPSDDVVADAPARGAKNTSAKATGAKATGAKPAPAAPASEPRDSGKGRWSVILATFSGPTHAENAQAFRGELVRQYPELSTAMVRRVGAGSALVVGRFEGPDDKNAQAELKRVKAIAREGRRPFAGAMLLRTATEDAPAAPKPHDIRNLRAKFPSVRPLYTLQVGAWSTFGEKGVDYDTMRKAAERYCAELRAKGQEAWFHHDEDRETSIVTIGHFDRRAYDTRSTLFAPEVEDLMRQYPAHLTNGEPVLILLDPSNPKGRTKPQGCRLVEVPLF